MKIGHWNLLFITLLTLLSVSATSCDDDKNEPKSQKTIVGKWTWSEQEGSYYLIETYTFKSDGTYLWQYKEGDSYSTHSGEQSGKYIYDNEFKQLTLYDRQGDQVHSERVTYDVKFTSSTMLLIKDEEVYGPYYKQ